MYPRKRISEENFIIRDTTNLAKIHCNISQ